MPTTVNGVGTHYYGKKNWQSRSGLCRACGREAALESYDTRLWFVVLFIPVVPLGRKRIIDQCSCCRRHFVASLSQWEMSKQLSVSGTMEQYRARPSPETALEAHAHLLGFHMHGEAATFRREALSQFADSAGLAAGLAVQMEQAGHFGESLPLFEKALALRPDLPEARVGIAFARMNEGKLDEARELLSFLEQPGAAELHSLGPLEALARECQRAGKHEDTLAICRHLLTEVPAAGQVRTFRQLVATSEKALRAGQSILPKQPFSLRGLLDRRSGRYTRGQRWLAIGAIAAVLVMVGMAVANEYRRRHRTVFAINDCGTPAQVTVDGREPVLVPSLAKLEMSEGAHHLKITGPVTEEIDVQMQTGYFDRWTRSPLWVINVGGAAAIEDETLHYAAHPRPVQGRVVLGEQFSFFEHVDFPFENPPHSMKADSKAAEVVKTHVGRVQAPVSAVFQYALHVGDVDAAFRFAESRLRLNSEDILLLFVYEEAAKESAQIERAEQFLKAGLKRDPLSVPWHRAYQDLRRSVPQRAELAAFYDESLTNRPRDARLLYLRGRVSPRRDQAHEFFRRASEADPALPWPWMALAYDAADKGDWPQARQCADKAFALKLPEPSVHWIRHAARLATGDTATMEAEYRQRLASDPAGEGFGVVLELCDVLAAQGKVAECRRMLVEWEGRLPAAARAQATPYRCEASYMLGDFIGATSETSSSSDLSRVRLHALACAGRPEEAAADKGLAKTLENPWEALALSLAFSLRGDERQSAEWRQRACAAMDREDDDQKRAAALLRSKDAPSAKQREEIGLSPNIKALLLAALAIRFPAQKAELSEEARRLNVTRMPPYHLTRQATERDANVRGGPHP